MILKAHVQTIHITPVTTRPHSWSRQRIAERESRNVFSCLKVLHDSHTTYICGTTFGFVYTTCSPWHCFNELMSFMFSQGCIYTIYMSKWCIDDSGVPLLHKVLSGKSHRFSGRLPGLHADKRPRPESCYHSCGPMHPIVVQTTAVPKAAAFHARLQYYYFIFIYF